MAPGIVNALCVLITSWCRRSGQNNFTIPSSVNDPPFLGPFLLEPFRRALNVHTNLFQLNGDDRQKQSCTHWQNRDIRAVSSLFSDAITLNGPKKLQALFQQKDSSHTRAIELLEKYFKEVAKIIPRINHMCDIAFANHNAGIDSLLVLYTIDNVS
jgi:hypothetical protein